MNTEAYMYTMLTAGIGIGVVFCFLGMLSLLMVGIKRLFGFKQIAPKEADEGTAEPVDDSRDWIMAAVAVYLNKVSDKKSAAPWVVSPAESNDPWVMAPRTGKFLTGV